MKLALILAFVVGTLAFFLWRPAGYVVMKQCKIGWILEGRNGVYVCVELGGSK